MSSPSASPCFLRCPALVRKNAFTFFEIVVVLGVLALIATLGIRMGPKLLDYSREQRVRGDFAVIQSGLEAYREQFGDYPRLPDTLGQEDGPFAEMDANCYLLNALNGKRGPDGSLIDASPMLANASLRFEKTELPSGDSEVINRILDAWGNPYGYDYRPKAEDWKAFGYTLYSSGADGIEGTADDIWAE